jgi:hypothetical protein
LDRANRGIPKNRNANKHWDSFFEEFDLLSSQLRNIKEQSGEITTGTAETDSPPGRHRIALQIDPDDGDCSRGCHHSPYRIWSGRDDHIALKTNQLPGEFAESVEGGTEKARLDSRVLTIDISCIP